MKGVIRILYVCLVTIIVTSAVVIAGCTSEPVSTTDTMTANQTTTTTSIVTNDEPTACQVLDLVVPEGEVEGVWNISVVITNTTNSQLSCNIPIKLYRVDDPTNFSTYTISATLNKDETKKVSYENIYVQDGSYEIEVSDIIKSVEVG